MKIDRRTFLVGAIGAAMCPWVQEDPPIATVEEGQLRGALEGGLRVFRGVPFAKPPVGPLRFRPTQPPSSWTGIRDALTQAPIAIQSGHNDSEDCLYLNVWAPTGKGPFPVYVWIHGGGNVGGGTAGQSGASFAQLGIVVVTVPYRLGSFGFLELGEVLGKDYESSGDNGIRDLEAALLWLNKNVQSFGGDPSKITIGGQSAGAKDVAALMATPSAHGLFSRAIMESGGGHTVQTAASAGEVADDLLTGLGLSRSTAKDLLTLPALEILAGQRRLEQVYPHDFPFRPYAGSDFLPKRPVDGVFGDVPLLLGTNSDESLAFFPRADGSKPIRSREMANLPFDKAQEMEARYRQAFPNESDLDRRIHLLTAEEYWIPSVRFATAHAAKGGATWMYRYTAPNTSGSNAGYATHGAELAYTWQHHDGWSMHETWAAFIKGQSPKWPQYDAAHRTTKVYGAAGVESTVEDPNGPERQLWEDQLQ